MGADTHLQRVLDALQSNGLGTTRLRRANHYLFIVRVWGGFVVHGDGGDGLEVRLQREREERVDDERERMSDKRSSGYPTPP